MSAVSGAADDQPAPLKDKPPPRPFDFVGRARQLGSCLASAINVGSIEVNDQVSIG
jgi:hypothetical protein